MKQVKVNGVWYRIAEDAEGAGYTLSNQPLRPPNAQILQGDAGTFQIRPDILQWSITDWSGGEGQIKFDPANPSRMYYLDAVSPFKRPGELTGAFHFQVEDNSGDTTFTEDTYLVKAIGGLFAIDKFAAKAYEYDDTNQRFKASESTTDSSGSSAFSAAGDEKYLFTHRGAGTNIMRRDSGATWTTHNDQCGLTSGIMMAELGSYLYIWEPLTGEVFEISKETANTATAETPLYYTDMLPNQVEEHVLMVKGDNRVYIAAPGGGNTMLHAVTPSSAAGAGFGTELAFFEGFVAETLWFSAGTVYMIGYDQIPDNNEGPQRQLLYVDPDGTYGTLGAVRTFLEDGRAHERYPVACGGRLALSAFVLFDGAVGGRLFEVDLVTGGMAAVGEQNFGSPGQLTSLVWYKGRYFTSMSGSSDRVGSWTPDAVVAGRHPSPDGIAITPFNDFDLTGEKVLERIEVITDPLRTGGEVLVQFSADNEGFDLVKPYIYMDTDDQVSAAVQVSDATTTYTFHTLQIQSQIQTESATSWLPVIKSIDVYVRVNRHLKVWDLLLDASDDAAPQGYNGAQIIDNIVGLGDNTVIEFIDRYASHDHTEGGDTYNVVVDTSAAKLTQPGEGTIAIRLIEVL